MDKLNLHETLRIYMPGLLFSLIVFCLFNGSYNGAIDMAIPALFIGFAFSPILNILSTKYFSLIVKEYKFTINGREDNYVNHRDRILLNKMNVFEVPFPTNMFTQDWSYAYWSFLAKGYETSQLIMFRLPKTFGVMCFNFFVIGSTSPLIFLISLPFAGYNISVWHVFLIGFCYILSIMFFAGANKFFQRSLFNEVFFWSSLSKTELEELVSHYKVQTKLNEQVAVA